MTDLDAKIQSVGLIDTLRGRIAELEDLEARRVATLETYELLVDLHELLDQLYRMMLSERAGKISH
jgi:hypothetical protein